MEYEIQFSRIATSDKLADRFLNCQSQSSNDLGKSFMGKTYSLVEILSPWFTAAQVGQNINATFTQSYYQSGSTSDLANFEESLKKVNENLARVTQNGETNWIGNLNSILAVVIENKLHLAQTGKAEAYIFRDGKVNHITYGLAETQTEPHPLKTFSNVTSGELRPHDKVLIANPDLFRYIDLESLRQIITLNEPYQSVLQIGKILRKKHAKTVNALILNLVSIEEASRTNTDPTADTIYLDKQLESYWVMAQKFYNQYLAPVLKILFHQTKKAGKKSLEFTRNYLTRLQENRQLNQPVKTKDLFDKEFLESPKDEGLLKDEEIKYSPELQVHYYEEKVKYEKSLSKKWEPFFNFLINAAIKTIDFIKNKKSRPYLYIAAACILLFFLGTTIATKRTSHKGGMTLLQAQTILKDAQNLQKNAQSAATSNKVSQAEEYYFQAISSAQKIENYSVVSADAKNIIKDSFLALDRLTATTRFSALTPVLSLASTQQIRGTFISNGYAYMLTKNEVYKGLISGGRIEKVAALPSNNGEILFGAQNGNNNLIIYTTRQTVFSLDLTQEKLTAAKTGTAWETANAGAVFGGNIYLASGVIGQIYKHAASGDGFAASEPYVNSASIDIKNSRSLAIDGSVYVLQNDGDILKLNRGKIADFNLSGIPSPNTKLAGATKIYTDTDCPSIYVLDNPRKRIVELDKDGTFLRQYALPDSFTSLTDFAVSVKSKKIWLSNANNLYSIDLK